MPESPSKTPLVWIDCEMTGLDYESDTILSIACYVTNADLELFDETGHVDVIHHDKATLDSMNEWCIEHHGASGLTGACLKSTTTAEQAAKNILEYIQRYVKKPRSALLAGNTVHMDRSFLVKEPYKPIIDYLSYRLLDVSSLKEAARRWGPQDILDNIPKKKNLHEARADILESIEEARYYRRAFFLQ